MGTGDRPSKARPRKVSRRPTASLKTRLHQSLATEIGTNIVSGRYNSGESLPGEIVASQERHVSRAAYREAVRILAAKGLVESRQKAGTLVTDRGRWNLLDPDVLHWILSTNSEVAFSEMLFELRSIIEPAAAALAAERRTSEDILAMETALQEMRSHPPDSPAGEQADERFHEAMFAAAGNEVLGRLASIIAASVKFVAEYKRAKHIERDTWPDHKALFDAIRAAKSNAAYGAMTNLIAHARADTSNEPPKAAATG